MFQKLHRSNQFLNVIIVSTGLLIAITLTLGILASLRISISAEQIDQAINLRKAFTGLAFLLVIPLGSRILFNPCIRKYPKLMLTALIFFGWPFAIHLLGISITNNFGGIGSCC